MCCLGNTPPPLDECLENYSLILPNSMCFEWGDDNNVSLLNLLCKHFFKCHLICKLGR